MIEGQWFAKGSSARCDAALEVEDDFFTLNVDGVSTCHGTLQELQVGSRLGNVQRKITLEDGSLFTTSDNDAVDKAFTKQLQNKGLIHTLESKSTLVLLALIITAVTAVSFFKWGIPWASVRIAHALPQETNQLISANTFELLDDYLFDESAVSTERQEAIKKHFQSKVIPLADPNSDISYKLHFRLWSDGNRSIPNALALPSGDIILTDKFVELSRNQEEIDAVLLHEMGHVVHRHTLEMVIEGTFVGVAVMMIIGDSNGLADMGIGLGSMLVSSNYSRGHESEADTYAFKHMLKGNIDPIAFSDIMNRMTAYMENNANATAHVEESEDNILDYLSSHPNTNKRVDIAQQYSECFKKGLQECTIIDKP